MRYAEEVNYWKTGQSSPDTWLEKAKREITTVDGQVLGEGFISEALTGKSSFMLCFHLQEEDFKVLWPVLKSKTGNIKAARVQAATALYHEVKASCVKFKFLGARVAFLAYLVLPNGRSAAEVATLELIKTLPQLLVSGEPKQEDL